MTLRQMEYLLVVAEEGSFTRAAEILRVSQPGLSQQIRALERAAGGELIERTTGTVRLTPAGRAYAEHARIALKAAEDARKAAREVLSGEAGELVIATVLSIAAGILPPSLLRWHTDNPKIPVTLLEYAHRRTLEESVASGAGDLAVGPTPKQWGGPVIDLGHEIFVLYLAPDDPILKKVQPYEGEVPKGAPQSRGVLPVSALHAHSWITFEGNHGLGEFIREYMQSANVTPDFVFHTGQIDSAVKLAGAGAGVALLPANALPMDGPGVAVEPFPALTRDLAVYSRTKLSPTAKRYVELLQKLPAVLEPPESHRRRQSHDQP
ncbi:MULTISPECIES: LysR family transcriptional regulator [Micrococcaceae]|uniref:LysR family transcriptional regulator n=1 Tax=Micrococcaceae TaxID=1268 RepID=UPI00256FD057|nr:MULTISPECIES: LysR family transcriptional regulator [Micrococcaceae]MBP2267346.1 DNA-binding transcriptional LysR family regulator [Pseudarthrobacter sp. PvP004]